jgi:2-polyprenyl-3-methyl-5-hydroxy-6-metoxy-1,4-benzoquinol methylase
MKPAPLCLCCGSSAVRLVPGCDGLASVSSDCKPVAANGALGSCKQCGLVQKIIDPDYRKHIDRIYSNYDSYYQGGGLEQMVFDERAGAIRRSELLARHLDVTGLLPADGRCLDFGCGRGAFLRAIGSVRARWKLSGLELDDRNLPALRSIPGFETLEIGEAAGISGGYALLSMIHALEHLLDPLATLKILREKIAADGYLFIQVPNLADNPFDLTIADHVSHFTPHTLTSLLSAAGFVVTTLSTDWVKKEISAIAKPAPVRASVERAPDEATLAARHAAWLTDVLSLARETVRQRPFGLFGTSIAAIWLSGGLGDNIDFYIDDDTARQHNGFLGKLVLARSAVPDGSTVFIGLAPAIANPIAEQLRRAGVQAVTPPPIASGRGDDA